MSGVRLNPPMDTALMPGDEIIAVTADDDTLLLSASTAPAVDESAISVRPCFPPKAENILLLGWNENALRIIQELDHYVSKGSKVTVASDIECAREELRQSRRAFEHCSVSLVEEDITERKTLDAPAERRLPAYPYCSRTARWRISRKRMRTR